MTSSTNEHHPNHRSPSSIRYETFSRRMRGLDAEEVYQFLDLLAEQVETAEAEHRKVVAENERLETELQRVRRELDDFDQVGDRVNEQVVELFSQAQLVAEEMVADVNHDARERLGHARAHEQQIRHDAVGVAGQEVRSYARAAQAQMQSIMDTFSSQIEQLADDPSASNPDGRGWA